MISRPVYLIFPAYIVGVASMFACLNILPYDVGVSIAAVLLLVMLTPATLLHPRIERIDDGSLGLHLLVYGACLVAAGAFAFLAIPENLPRTPFPTAPHGCPWPSSSLSKCSTSHCTPFARRAIKLPPAHAAWTGSTYPPALDVAAALVQDFRAR